MVLISDKKKYIYIYKGFKIFIYKKVLEFIKIWMFSNKSQKRKKWIHVVPKIRSFTMNISRIAETAIDRKEKREWNYWSENWKCRRNWRFFFLRRLKVTRVTRVRSKNVCSSHELLFQDHYRSTVFGNWTNVKNVPRDLLSSRTNSLAFAANLKNLRATDFFEETKNS